VIQVRKLTESLVIDDLHVELQKHWW